MCLVRFPREKSIASVVRRRYGNQVVKDIRRLEKLDFKHRKIRLDIEFLSSCEHHNVIPKFLQFRTATKLTRPADYNKYQKLMLRDEIKAKETLFSSTLKQFEKKKESLHAVLSSVDFAHICTVYLCGNDNRINQVRDTHDKKLFNLMNDVSSNTLDSDKIIHNFSSYMLSDVEKSLLRKGLNFTIRPNKLNYADYCINFELLFRDVLTLKMDDKANEDLLKTKLKELALSSFYHFNNHAQEDNSLSSSEFSALESLAKKRDLIIQKSDKGNSIVLIDKIVYCERMEQIVSDSNKFLVLSPNIIKEGCELQYIDKHEEKVRSFLKKLLSAKKISKRQHDLLYPRGSKPGVLYGLPKIHKQLVDGIPKFRPILSAIGTCSYKLAKFLVPILKDISVNDFTIGNSFEFGKEVLKQDASLYMGSLDVEALFTSLPLIETINICVSELFKNKETINNLTKNEFKTFLEFATNEPWFIFNNNFYKQVDGVAMGSPLGPTLANVFMSHFEKKWLEVCPISFKPVFYRRYIDDIFVMFKSEDHIKLFADFMNTCHSSIKFTFEKENNNAMPFLDFEFSRNGSEIVSSVYRKPTYTGLYTHFESLIPHNYKRGLILTLLHRVFNTCSNMKIIVKEIDKLKNILCKNGYPLSLIDRCIYTFFEKLYITKPQITTVEKKQLFLVLPFLGKQSLELKHKLEKVFNNSLPFCNLRILFNSSRRLSNWFSFKDKIPKHLLSHNVYHFQCTGCDSSYIGLAERHTFVRIYDHLGISWRTNKPIVGVPTEIKEHVKIRNCEISADNFRVLAQDNDSMRLRIKESLFIKKDRPNLNKMVYSTPLYLF